MIDPSAAALLERVSLRSGIMLNPNRPRITAVSSSTVTPMMSQWHAVKARHGDGILFFRMGDFFEFFHDDAKKAARLLGLTLTSRSKGEGNIPMAGVPARSVDAYVRRLVRLGERVVICDQVEDPREADGLVDRQVVRIVTAGTLTEDEALDARAQNFLVAMRRGRGRSTLAWVDLSTGDFATRTVPDERLSEEAARLDPAECLIPESQAVDGNTAGRVSDALGCPVGTRSDLEFDDEGGRRRLERHFGTRSLEGFGFENDFPFGAAGAILAYLEETQRGALGQIRRLRAIDAGGFMSVDRSTRAALELVRTLREGERDGSLFGVLDRTLTPMGARTLRSWVLAPLLDAEAIRERLDAVATFVDDPERLTELRDSLGGVLDVERLAARVGCLRASPRDLVALRESLSRLPAIRGLTSETSSAVVERLARALPDFAGLVERLAAALVDEPPVALKEGGLIKTGFSTELDELRGVSRDGKDFIAEFQARHTAATGIPLKVGFNKVFGYYVEVTNAWRDRLPAEFVRKQTLKNAERFVTDELKQHEDRVLHADERRCALEYGLFVEVRAEVAERLDDLQAAARTIAEIDALQALAKVARTEGYVRPEVGDGTAFEIEEGRHPVLSRSSSEGPFVPNDVALDDDRRIMLITGPNMAGKSTYIRQVALLALMAQVGSFVPARRARIPVFDRIFTRVGAHDDIAHGASTFMVEMLEVANILNNATSRSLVILDEVGRGTSTYDGLALAWAITEHLWSATRAKTLFATHYHELVELAESRPEIRNFNVAVREWGQEIIFLHKIVAGGTDRSYGIHVAGLAGIPKAVLVAARGILERLERGGLGDGAAQAPRPSADVLVPRAAELQLGLFADPTVTLCERLAALDLDATTPRQALDILGQLQGEVRQARSLGH